MAEERQGPDAGGEAGIGLDPAAMAMALGSASRSEADAFLRDQRALIADQRHHLQEQLKNLRLIIWTNRTGVFLRVATALVGVAVAVFLGAFVWNAARADGLVVESFSVPPDLAARGLTGDVVATALLNNISTMQNQTLSGRAASSFTNNWGNDIKVEIPETGVSIGELNRYLRQWLGHETHITGALYHTAAGIAVTAQVGEEAHATLAGSETDLDQTLQKTSEAIYHATQPYRYAVYLRSVARIDEAAAAFQDLIKNGDPREQPWAIIGLANVYFFQGDLERAVQLARRAYATRPDFYTGALQVKDRELLLQLDEAAFVAAKEALAFKSDPSIIETQWIGSHGKLNADFANLQGDYQTASKADDFLRDIRAARFNRPTDPDLDIARALLGAHEIKASAALRGSVEPTQAFNIESARAAEEFATYAAQGRWPMVLERRAALENGLAEMSPYWAQFTSRNIWPVVAYAMAMTGDAAGADALIGKTPIDCSLCLRMRGRLAALEKNWDSANDWFAKAAQFAPSTPFPFQDWGQALLDKGDAAGAIAKFTLANKKGPHFADPLEGWGEALMAQNRSHQALAKFAEAEKYAPNWGRLHLKWGEALAYAGKRDDAKAQFARAAQLDLTQDEKAELGEMAHG